MDSSAQYAGAEPTAGHRVCPEMQVEVQTPLVQVSWAPQATPHAPQFLLSVAVVAQYGAAPASDVQSVEPPPQFAVQAPLAQI